MIIYRIGWISELVVTGVDSSFHFCTALAVRFSRDGVLIVFSETLNKKQNYHKKRNIKIGEIR